MSIEINGKAFRNPHGPGNACGRSCANSGISVSRRAAMPATCGACTVLLDGEPVHSCLIPAFRADGHAVTTIEGVAPEGSIHPVQQAFLDAQAFQCGFCTSGMILTCASLNQAQRQDLGASLKGNICRCTGYRSIEDALNGKTNIEDAAAGTAFGRSLPAPAGPRWCAAPSVILSMSRRKDCCISRCCVRHIRTPESFRSTSAQRWPWPASMPC